MSTAVGHERLITAEDLYAMSEDAHRYELVDGRLVVAEPPAMWHGAIAAELTLLLAQHVKRHHLGMVFGEAGYVLRRGPDTVRGPDLSFVRTDRLPPASAARRYYEGAPDLAVEIVSPSNRAEEVARKVDGYLGAGAARVWVVYPELRRVVVHRPDGTARMLGDDATLDGEDVVPGFAAPVAALFPTWPGEERDAPPTP